MPCNECVGGYLALSSRPCWVVVEQICSSASTFSSEPVNAYTWTLFMFPLCLLPSPATDTRVFILGPGDILWKIANQPWCTASLFIPSHWLTVKAAESIGPNYVDSVSRPLWQKMNWDPNFLFHFFCLYVHGWIDFCQLEMQSDEKKKTHKTDHWTFTKYFICLLWAGLNWHTLIYHTSLVIIFFYVFWLLLFRKFWDFWILKFRPA